VFTEVVAPSGSSPFVADQRLFGALRPHFTPCGIDEPT
jgi:hypothetical protein